MQQPWTRSCHSRSKIIFFTHVGTPFPGLLLIQQQKCAKQPLLSLLSEALLERNPIHLNQASECVKAMYGRCRGLLLRELHMTLFRRLQKILDALPVCLKAVVHLLTLRVLLPQLRHSLVFHN